MLYWLAAAALIAGCSCGRGPDDPDSAIPVDAPADAPRLDSDRPDSDRPDSSTGCVVEVPPPTGPEISCPDNAYGTPGDAAAIEDAMYSGPVAAAQAAILAAQATRGTALGCPQLIYDRASPQFEAPTPEELQRLWTEVHRPHIEAYDLACPGFGRVWPATGLGGFLVGLAGLDTPEAALTRIADNLLGAQYRAEHAPEPLITASGVFGASEALADATSPCAQPGVAAETFRRVCAFGPRFCQTYDNGPWAGMQFAIIDISTADPRALDGGLAYDQGWSAALMTEAGLSHSSAEARARYLASANLAAEWSAAEPSVRNHNYTAKNVWVLAQAYGRTGDSRFRDAMLDRLERNLEPGVLMDQDCDGEVDGHPGLRFDSLIAPTARLPGRYWDGHNALLWYTAMNAWALVEAYVALRDRGDEAEARDVRPYVIAVLDSMAWELNHLGPGMVIGPGAHPIPFALLTGLWKLAQAEGEAHPEWERATSVLYNTGYLNTADGRSTANLGMYLLVTQRVPYVPLGSR